jgi:Cys-tRNA(Pro) deacylase
MAREEFPVTAATRVLKQHGVAWESRLFAYEDKGGTRASSAALGIDEHLIAKTLILEDDTRSPLCVVMHGDLEVSARELGRQLGHRNVAMAAPETASKHSGYLVGGTSPFGLRKAMPVYVESSIFELPRIWLNGGKRGFIIGIDPAVLRTVLDAQPVQAGRPRSA